MNLFKQIATKFKRNRRQAGRSDTTPLSILHERPSTLKIALSSGFSIAVSDLIKEGDRYTKYITHSFKHYKN